MIILDKSPTFRVKVDQECIDLAIPEDSGNCMISQAIRKCYPFVRFVSTDIRTIRLTENGNRRVYWLPENCRQALLDFDDERKPKPFDFELSSRNVAQTVPAAVSMQKKQFERKDYEPIRIALVKTVTESRKDPDHIKTVPIDTFLKENKIASKSAGTYLSPNGTIPSVKTVKKILEWAEEKSPKSPLASIAKEKIQELNEKFTAPIQEKKIAPIKRFLRPESANSSNPEQIGGKTLPVSRLGQRRIFGERKYKNTNI